jgi:pyruvate-ferredoxin/flavodoxin oxidoreductase
MVLMGSGVEDRDEAIEALRKKGEKVGMVVRLFRPFSVKHFLAALPARRQVHRRAGSHQGARRRRRTAVSGCDDGTLAEGLTEGWLPTPAAMPRVIGGRYGLSSKEFTPAMVKAVFDELKKDKPKNHFTVGIIDDVTHSHLDVDPGFITEPDNVVRAMFYGLGADGTVGANKNSIKIIGEETDFHAQGYFVYDSKKVRLADRFAPALRAGSHPLPYLIQSANFIGCHQFNFLEKADVLKNAAPGCRVPAEQPVRRRAGVGPSARPRAGADHRQEDEVLCD